jgi:hypothetical protein
LGVEERAERRGKGLRVGMQVRPVRMKESHSPLTIAVLASDIHQVLSSGSTAQIASTPAMIKVKVFL